METTCLSAGFWGWYVGDVVEESDRKSRVCHQECQVPYKAILGVGFPLHKPYIQLI